MFQELGAQTPDVAVMEDVEFTEDPECCLKFALFIGFCFLKWIIVLQESPEPLDEVYCIKGDLADPIWKPDRYVFPNKEEVHMVAESISRQDLQQLYLNLITLCLEDKLSVQTNHPLLAACRSWKRFASNSGSSTERRLPTERFASIPLLSGYWLASR